VGLLWRHFVVLGNSNLGQLQPCKGRGLQCSKPHTQHVVVVVDYLMCCEACIGQCAWVGWVANLLFGGCWLRVWGARLLSERIQGNSMLNME
jgi:hypothetical protein